ncbi:MAG: AAA-like domain-containing protein [Deltaproteobacteria bacterium]|nr:AAA-like domain-containing protein [Deltaproteobacteria bacterium]
MPNPYLWRTTIKDPADFYGRNEEIEYIYERIGSKTPQSIAVVSERKMGKSSLLYYIYHEKDKHLDNPEKYIFVFIDIQGEIINSRDDFFKVLLKRLRENEEHRDKIVLDNRDNHKNIEETVSQLDIDGYKIILFLDEFDLLLRKESIPPELYENLRALANRYAVAYITATVKTPIELTKEYSSPFFNIFTRKSIGAFNKEEAMELIEVPSARENVPLRDEVEFIFTIAGLYPYFIQIACSILFEYKSKKEQLSKSDYAEIREKFLNESKFQFEHICKHLNTKEKKVLLKLTKSKSIGDMEKYIIKDLETKGYITKKGDEYEIFSSSFKKFMANKKGVEKEGVKDNIRYGIRTCIPIIVGLLVIVAVVIHFKLIEDLIKYFLTLFIGSLLAFVLYHFYRCKRTQYTSMIDIAYRKYPKNSQELCGELNKIKVKLSTEMSSKGYFGSLKSSICEKIYGEKLMKKIDQHLSENSC